MAELLERADWLSLTVVCGVTAFVFIFFRYLPEPPPADPREPMSDDEFVRSCGSNVRPEVALTTRRIIAESTGRPPESIRPDDIINQLC